MRYFLDIFIPAYGESRYLSQAIESAIESGLKFETRITVIDDGSVTDDVRNTVERYKNEVRFIRNELNLGISRNFKKCHNLGDAILTLIMGSDDMLMPNSVEILFKMYHKFPDSIFYHLNPVIINENSVKTNTFEDKVKRFLSPKSKVISQFNSKEILPRLAIGNFTYFPAIAWNNSTKSKIKWNVDYELAPDLDILFNLCLEPKNKFTFTSLESFMYRRHSTNQSIILLKNGQRISEELDLHSKIYRDLKNHYFIKTLLVLAPSIRAHTLLQSFKTIFFNPVDAFNLFKKAFGIAQFLKRPDIKRN